MLDPPPASQTAVLNRTIQLLVAQHPLPENVRQAEQDIVKASEQKAEADMAKGHSMDELSTIVTQITGQLKEKKTQLAPQIKALRDVRAKFSQVGRSSCGGVEVEGILVLAGLERGGHRHDIIAESFVR